MTCCCIAYQPFPGCRVSRVLQTGQELLEQRSMAKAVGCEEVNLRLADALLAAAGNCSIGLVQLQPLAPPVVGQAQQ